MPDIETVVIGAGVIGLAIARALAVKGQNVLILEQHGLFGSETSARNSEVIHAGIYYPKDSLKARFCVDGREKLYAYCTSHHVPFRRTGKLIVASHKGQLDQLESIRAHAQNNGVDDIKKLDESSLNRMEPGLTGVGALFSPSTGIIDSHYLMLSMLGDAEAAGAMIAYHSPVSRLSYRGHNTFDLAVSGEHPTELTCRNIVVCGGLSSHKLLAGLPIQHPAAVSPREFAKGNYFKLTGKTPFQHLIYPVPEPGGLGVHLTLDMAGQARFGPDVEWVTDLTYTVDPKRVDSFYAAIREYWPELPDDSLEPDYAGIRPKIVGEGATNADFVVLTEKDHGFPGLIAPLGIESPSLTSCLAIADHLASLPFFSKTATTG